MSCSRKSTVRSWSLYEMFRCLCLWVWFEQDKIVKIETAIRTCHVLNTILFLSYTTSNSYSVKNSTVLVLRQEKLQPRYIVYWRKEFLSSLTAFWPDIGNFWGSVKSRKLSIEIRRDCTQFQLGHCFIELASVLLLCTPEWLDFIIKHKKR